MVFVFNFLNNSKDQLASLVAQRLKHLPAMRETWVRSLVGKIPLEKEMATHSSILAWRIPWMERSIKRHTQIFCPCEILTLWHLGSLVLDMKHSLCPHYPIGNISQQLFAIKDPNGQGGEQSTKEVKKEHRWLERLLIIVSPKGKLKTNMWWPGVLAPGV